MYAELAGHLYPKRRAVDQSATEGSGEIVLSWSSPATPAQNESN